MEENKSKKSVGVSLVLVIAILVIALVVCITYIIKNNEKEIAINNDNSEKTINELRTEVSNLKDALAKKDKNLSSINDEKSFNLEGEIGEFIQESDFSKSISVSYVVNGINKGELRIRNNAEIVYTKKMDKKIIDINSIDYVFEREIFVLFEDGKVGKISVSDIEKKEYKIEMVANIENIVRIQELYFLNNNSGTDFVLVAIDEQGKIYTLDSVNG